MAATITVEGKVAGQRRPLFSDWQVPIPPEVEAEGGRITLRGLITQVVHAEVAAYKERQEARRLDRVLSAAQIEQGAATGKIDAAAKAEPAGDVDPQAAVDTALLAFQDGLYYVFVDGEQRTDLESELYVQADTRVTFLRLVLLAGG